MTAISSAWAAGRNEMPGDTTVQPSSPRTELTGHSWSALPQGNGSSSPADRDAAVAGGAGSFGSFAASASVGADPHAGQPSPGLSNGGLSNGGPANGGSSGAPSDGPGVPYGEQPYGTDPYTGQAYGWPSPPSGWSSGPPADTGPAPAETGLPWPYDRPAPGGNGPGRPPATPFPASDPPYPPAGTYRPYTQDETAFPPPGDPFPAPQAPLSPAEPPSPQAQASYSEAGPAMPPAGVSDPSAETALPPAGSFPNENGAQAQQDEMYKGLPKRVRQASLAPQLRERTTPGSTPSAASGDTVVNRSPDGIRNALSAMQRGWQQGRAANEGGSPEQDGAPANGAHAARGNHAGGPDDGTVPGGERLVTNEERATPQGHGGGNDSAGDVGCGSESRLRDSQAPTAPAAMDTRIILRDWNQPVTRHTTRERRPAATTSRATVGETMTSDRERYPGGHDDTSLRQPGRRAELAP